MNQALKDMMNLNWYKEFYENKSIVYEKFFENLNELNEKNYLIYEYHNFHNYESYYSLENKDKLHVVYRGNNNNYIIRTLEGYFEIYPQSKYRYYQYKNPNNKLFKFEGNYVECVAYCITMDQIGYDKQE